MSVTGQPRLDLVKPGNPWWRAPARELVNRHGRYVLINTNLTSAVSAEGFRGWLTLGLVRGRGSEELPVSSNDRRRLASDLHALSGVIRVIDNLAQSDLCDTVVVRPHPSESLTTYETLFVDLPSTVVSREGPAGPWIKGAAVIAHTACTTGIEAGLARRPVVGLNFQLNP